MLLARLLQKVPSSTVRTGTLRVTPVGGPAFTVGDGTGPLLALRFTSRAAELGMLLDPELGCMAWRGAGSRTAVRCAVLPHVGSFISRPPLRLAGE